MKKAAAKGRRHTLLAAVCLIASLLIVPSAEASRNVTTTPKPALISPAMPDQVLEESDAEPQPRHRLFGDLSLLERPFDALALQKNASGIFALGIQSNIRKTGCLAQNRSGPTFQGLWTDPVTGIAYARNRWYDARTASWLSEDPMGSVDSPNLYAFVGWGPHVYTDPMGTWKWLEKVVSFFTGSNNDSALPSDQYFLPGGGPPVTLSEAEERELGIAPTPADQLGRVATGMVRNHPLVQADAGLAIRAGTTAEATVNLATTGEINTGQSYLREDFDGAPLDLVLLNFASPDVVEELREKAPGVAFSYENSNWISVSLLFLADSPFARGKGAGLSTRAKQVHGALDPIAQTQRTTAVLETNAGRVVAGGARDLTPAQRALLEPGETAARLSGAHAEVTAISHAHRSGLTPKAIAVTRKICPDCAAAIEASGGTLTGETTAVWSH